jgi:hypothetical protein
MSSQHEETHLSRHMKRRRRQSWIVRVAAVLVVSLTLVALIDLLLNPGGGNGSVGSQSPTARQH